MSRRKKHDTPQWRYEQAMIDAYYDDWMHRTLDPLYEDFQRWKRGELTHWDMDKAIHEAHKQNQEVYKFFTQKRDFIVGLIKMDEAWFEAWVAQNPPPPGVGI